MRQCGKTLKQNFDLLKEYKYLLTKQQHKTLKGQLLSGDIEGFRKGLFKIAKIKYIGRKSEINGNNK